MILANERKEAVVERGVLCNEPFVSRHINIRLDWDMQILQSSH